MFQLNFDFIFFEILEKYNLNIYSLNYFKLFKMVYYFFEKKKFHIINDKFILNEILNLLEYPLTTNDVFISKEELYTLFLNKEKFLDKKFMDFIDNDFYKPSLDFLTYILKKKKILIKKDSYEELWLNLKNEEEVEITNNVISKFYNLQNNNSISVYKEKFIKFLKINLIEHKLIKNNEDFDIILNKKNFNLLSKNTFIKIKKKYKRLVNVKDEYINYLKEYEENKTIELYRRENIYFDENNKNKLFNTFLSQKQNPKNEWIYIYSYPSFQIHNLYGINAINIIDKYNFNKTYCIKIFECINGKFITKIIKLCLNKFKYQNIYYNIHIFDLIDIVTFIINNYNLQDVNIINNYLTQKLKNIPYKEPTIFYELNIDYEISQTLKNKIYNYLDNVNNNEIIYKNQIIYSIQSQLTIDSFKIWKEFVTLFDWKEDQPIEYKNKIFFVYA